MSSNPCSPSRNSRKLTIPPPFPETGGNSHPTFTSAIATHLGIAPASRLLTKFSSGETRCEIADSVRGKDVYIVQSFGIGAGANRVNDFFIELCIMISACKTGSARRVTAVLPLFPYSRQPDLPYAKAGAPLSAPPPREAGFVAGGGGANANGNGNGARAYTFESVPATPGPSIPRTAGFEEGIDVVDMMARASLGKDRENERDEQAKFTTHDYENPTLVMAVQAKTGYKQWMAQAGSLVADLLTCAGADRVLTCDLHEGTYQGFFDIPGEFGSSPLTYLGACAWMGGENVVLIMDPIS